MCLKFDVWCCFGPGPGHEDDHCRSPAKGTVLPPHHHAVPPKTTTPHHHPPPAQRNGHYHHGHQQGVAAHHANGHRAPHHNHHQQQLPVAAAAEEETRKATNDLRRGHAGAAINGAQHGYAAGAAYVYSGPEGTVKQAARNNTLVVADDEGRRERAHHVYPVHRDYTADHRYPATATTASIADYGR